MRFVLLVATATVLSAQTVQSLTAQIQRTPTAALYVERGTAYLGAGDAKQAIADYDRALERDATHIQALTLRAQAYAKLNRHGDAITDLSGAIALSPGDAELYLHRSEAYAATGDAAHAKQDRDEALRLAPDILDRIRTQSVATPPVITASAAPTVAAPKEPALPARPKPQVTAPQPAAPKAEPAPAPAAPSDPASANAHYQRGRELVFQDKHSEGRTELREALRLDPRNAVLYNTLGFSYYSTKDYKQAIEMFDQAIQINPNYLNATRNRALAKRGMGDMKGYEADHQRELELSRAEKNKKR